MHRIDQNDSGSIGGAEKLLLAKVKNASGRIGIFLVYPVDNFGTVVGKNPTPYGILALWAVTGLSIVYWVS